MMKKRKVLSLFLCVVVIYSMIFGTSVFAADLSSNKTVSISSTKIVPNVMITKTAYASKFYSDRSSIPQSISYYEVDANGVVWTGTLSLVSYAYYSSIPGYICDYSGLVHANT